MIKISINAYALNHELPAVFYADFTDNEEISYWAKYYVACAVQLGIINGLPDGSFAPKAYTTRAQSAVITKRIFDLNK